MIEGLKPYPEYKDSRLPWAPQIPAHWKLVPNRAVLRRRKILVGKEHVNFQLLSLTKGGVIVRDISTGKGKFSSDMGTSQEVRPGDFVFCLFDVPETPRTVGLSKHHGMITSAYTLLEPRNLPELGALFLEQFYIAMDNHKLLSPLYSGLRNTIPPTRFLGTKTPLPPQDEQAAIVRFLDHANQKIDGFIRAKRKLIGLLNEQKQAIIHRAVTGKDEVRRMKDENGNSSFTLHPSSLSKKPSGIPWLGDIPKHWEVRRLRTLARKIEQGVSPQATGFLAEGDSWGVLKSGCVNHGIFRQTEHKQLAKSFHIDPAIAVKVGDVLISRACGSPKLVGSVGKVRSLDYKLILSDKTFRAIFHPTVNTDFMVYAMNCAYYRQQVEQATSGAEGMANNLPLSELRSFVFAIPPVAEARVIADHLDNELNQFNTAIARTEREIALMQEYRTRLTADLVTGKLDVREAAAKLPKVEAEPASEMETNELLDKLETEEIEA